MVIKRSTFGKIVKPKRVTLLAYNKADESGWPFQSEHHCYLPAGHGNDEDNLRQALEYVKHLPDIQEDTAVFGQSTTQSLGTGSDTPPPSRLNFKTAIVLWKPDTGPMCQNGPTANTIADEVGELFTKTHKDGWGRTLKFDQAYLDNVVAPDWAKSWRAAFLGNITIEGLTGPNPDVYQGSEFVLQGTWPCGTDTTNIAGCGYLTANKICNHGVTANNMKNQLDNDPRFDGYHLIIQVVLGCWYGGGGTFINSGDSRKYLNVWMGPIRGLVGTPFWPHGGNSPYHTWLWPTANTDYMQAPWNGCAGPLNKSIWEQGLLRMTNIKEVHENQGYMNVAIHEFSHSLATQGISSAATGWSHKVSFNETHGAPPSQMGCPSNQWNCAGGCPDPWSETYPCDWLAEGPDGVNCQWARISYRNIHGFDVMGTEEAYNVSQDKASAEKLHGPGSVPFGGTAGPNLSFMNWRGILPNSNVYDLTSEPQNDPNWSWEGWLYAGDYQFKFPEDPISGKQVLIKTEMPTNRANPTSWGSISPTPKHWLTISYFSRGYMELYGPKANKTVCGPNTGPLNIIETGTPAPTKAGLLYVEWGPWSTANGLNSFATVHREVDIFKNLNVPKFQIGPFATGGTQFNGWKVYVIEDEIPDLGGPRGPRRRKIKLRITRA